MATPVTLVDDTQPSGKAVGTTANPLIMSAAASAPSAFSSTKQEDVPAADADYGSASLWVRRDTNVTRTNLDGDYQNPAVDQYGNGKNSLTPTDLASAAVPNVATTVVASSLVLKATAGNLYDFSVTAGASAGYLMIFNATTAPADGTVTPAVVLAIAANASIGFTYPYPKRFTTGITMVFSTTGPFTKTASATAFLAGGVV